MTPTPGQPLSEADVSLLPCPFCGGEAEIEQFGNTRCSTIYCCQECGCKLETGEEFYHGRAWNRRPHAPVSRPGDGVEWPAVTNVWAETYCALTGKNPDGQQVTFVDGATVTTFRDMAKREIEAMLCAAPKAAVRAVAALTPPAEPVSRPAGEGEREAVARVIDRKAWDFRDCQHEAIDRRTDLPDDERARLKFSSEMYVEPSLTKADAILSLLRPAAPDAGQIPDCDGCDAGHRCMGVGNVCNPQPGGER